MKVTKIGLLFSSSGTDLERKSYKSIAKRIKNRTKRGCKHNRNCTRMWVHTHFKTYTRRERYAHMKILDLGHFDVVSLQCEREKDGPADFPKATESIQHKPLSE